MAQWVQPLALQPRQQMAADQTGRAQHQHRRAEGEQVATEIVVDREALDQEPFKKDGGFNRLNRIFDGGVEAVLADVNEELWQQAS